MMAHFREPCENSLTKKGGEAGLRTRIKFSDRARCKFTLSLAVRLLNLAAEAEKYTFEQVAATNTIR